MAERVQAVLSHLQGKNNPQAPAPGLRDALLATQPYRYTLNGNLTAEQRRHYEEHGFLVVKKLVAPGELKKYHKRFREICMREVHVPGMTIMRDIAIAKSEFQPGERAVSKLQDFQNDDVLFSYCSLPEVLNVVRNFVGDDVMAMHTMLINKPPDPGTKSSRHPMHQDLHYFPFRPADRIVCSWTAMEHVHRQNGCLVVVPGSHKGELLAHEYPKWQGGVNKLYHGIQNYDPSYDRVHLEMEPGDTVFFHPLLIHGSGMNRTQGFRKSISCHYAAANCHYIETEGTEHTMIANEMKELIEKKMGGPVEGFKMSQVWQIKGRLVSGQEKNM